MKKISVMIPCYNEIENVEPMAQAVTEILQKELPEYDYELLFIDNRSTDGTREKLRGLCAKNPKIKAIFNAANFGQMNSPFYGLCQTTGDCVIGMCCDFQDPVELIPVFVRKWEEGHRLVIGVKTDSKENALVYFLRTCYYKLIRNLSDVKMIEHFTGFGLYDKSFISILQSLHDPIPFIRGVVAEYGAGFNMAEVAYRQEKRKAGKTHNNFYTLYDAAMLSFTSYTKVGLRIATMLGFLSSGVSMLIAIYYFVMKLTHWYSFEMGNAPLLLGVYLLGSLQLLFIGLIGEYILNINTRVINRPLVVEEERLNFEAEPKKDRQV